jgi:hypothetical protein
MAFSPFPPSVCLTEKQAFVDMKWYLTETLQKVLGQKREEQA